MEKLDSNRINEGGSKLQNEFNRPQIITNFERENLKESDRSNKSKVSLVPSVVKDVPFDQELIQNHTENKPSDSLDRNESQFEKT